MEKTFIELRNIITEAEKNTETLILNKLPYKLNELSPVLSQINLTTHYKKLAQGYVEKFNSNEGDKEFNRAGAFLHNILFQQFQKPKVNNKPVDSSLKFINQHFKSFDKFKEEIINIAMSIQGSGWIYLSSSGKIKTIPNHKISTDILLLIDWWEHAWIIDYGANKHDYINNIWRVINWSVINDRINTTT